MQGVDCDVDKFRCGIIGNGGESGGIFEAQCEAIDSCGERGNIIEGRRDNSGGFILCDMFLL